MKITRRQFILGTLAVGTTGIYAYGRDYFGEEKAVHGGNTQHYGNPLHMRIVPR